MNIFEMLIRGKTKSVLDALDLTDVQAPKVIDTVISGEPEPVKTVIKTDVQDYLEDYKKRIAVIERENQHKYTKELYNEIVYDMESDRYKTKKAPTTDFPLSRGEFNNRLAEIEKGVANYRSEMKTELDVANHKIAELEKTISELVSSREDYDWRLDALEDDS